MPKKTLLWNDISDFARGKFDVWTGEGQHVWAEQAWEGIIQAGLADYKDEIERHIVLIRLMALVTMYREFCDLVWQEAFYREDIVSDG
ncbi:MAG: hypothetical protein CVU89_14525 [Firmicutes bacterium HGW-Firmicutes-14]|jgi:hypothetical protein|nr:MAG: hypothetical protein CVU89_14525 [Firmicutes bacterium HGW-Firmicutes-14]